MRCSERTVQCGEAVSAQCSVMKDQSGSESVWVDSGSESVWVNSGDAHDTLRLVDAGGRRQSTIERWRGSRSRGQPDRAQHAAGIPLPANIRRIGKI